MAGYLVTTRLWLRQTDVKTSGLLARTSKIFWLVQAVKPDMQSGMVLIMIISSLEGASKQGKNDVVRKVCLHGVENLHEFPQQSCSALDQWGLPRHFRTNYWKLKPSWQTTGTSPTPWTQQTTKTVSDYRKQKRRQKQLQNNSIRPLFLTETTRQQSNKETITFLYWSCACCSRSFRVLESSNSCSHLKTVTRQWISSVKPRYA